ncbi:tripartite motif-containing protein 2-like [Glandiceps talaboti]
MASADSKFLGEVNENFLICGICTERYKHAKMLPCLHNFCSPCLGKLVKSGHISCPLCRRTYEVADGDVANLPDNTFVDGLVEQFRKRDVEPDKAGKCEGCEVGDIVMRCVQCAMTLCENCVRTHRKVPFSRSHHLMSLDEYRSTKSTDPASVQPPLYCTRHRDNQLKFYCDTCETAICLECTAVHHLQPEHKYRYLEEASKGFKEDLTEMTERLKLKETQASEGKDKVEEITRSLDANYQKAEEKLNEHIEKTVEITTNKIRENGKCLQSTLKNEHDNWKTNLNAQFKELECSEGDMANAREFAENLMHYGNAAQLMTAKKGMTSQIQELLTNEIKTEPVAHGYIDFNPSPDFVNADSLGTIVTKCVPTCQVSDAPKFVRVAEEVNVTLTIKDTMDPAYDVVTKTDIIAEMKTLDDNSEDVKVRDNKDGTFSLVSQGKVVGDHQLSVSVYGKPVLGSPVMIKVIPHKGLIRKIGEKGSGVGQLNDPYGVTLTRSGDVLVCDRCNYRLQLFSSLGGNARVINVTGVGSSQFIPRFAYVSDNNEIFVTDGGNEQVVVCDENGKVIRCFGKGELSSPQGIVINPVNGMVYVLDRGSKCVGIYNQDGKSLKSFGSKGSGPGQFASPFGLCCTRAGHVIVPDTDNHCVQVFDADGNHLYSFGRKGNGDGEFDRPEYAVEDKEGNLIVSEYANSRMQKFDVNGKFICHMYTKDGGFNSPIGMCISDDKPFGNVIVADTSNSCVKVFAQ